MNENNVYPCLTILFNKNAFSNVVSSEDFDMIGNL